MARAELPPAVWVIPWAGLLILPAMGSGPIGSRLAVLFAELLFGLPLLLATPAALRPEVMPFPRLSRLWLWFTAAAIPLAAVLYQSLHQLVNRLLPLPPALEETLRRALEPGTRVESILIGTSLLLVAPVMEELFFRGLLPWLWGRRFRHGILAGPAALFALSHSNPWAFPTLFLLGLFLGWLKRSSGSLLPGMLVHGAINLLGYIMLQWPPGGP